MLSPNDIHSLNPFLKRMISLLPTTMVYAIISEQHDVDSLNPFSKTYDITATHYHGI